ncbi:hypothetical protein [Actinoplanes sp. NPDC049802]|uniref:hypothetical protein n=1 Tax=Actinoplanes sp. NPDC049802 TaxID=3154742 RepID=UPI0033D7B734
MSRNPEGPYPYPTTPEWAENLYSAIVSTCHQLGLVPPPRSAVLEGLAPALGPGEAKRVTDRRNNQLKPTAYHIENRGTDHELLLLNVDLHGAASIPWPLNDRTRNDWLHLTPENTARLNELVGAKRAVSAAKALRARAIEAQRRQTATTPASEKRAAEDAVAHASTSLAAEEARLTAAERALAGRRPLPAVRTFVEGDRHLTALVTNPMAADVAAEIQSHAVAKLRERGQRRPYELIESLVQEGQRESTIVVLQQTPVEAVDGTEYAPWRPVQVTGNNRADARLQIMDIDAAHLLTGVPQPLLVLDNEPENRVERIHKLSEILRRLSTRLNLEYADSQADPEGRAQRAVRVAVVRSRVVVGSASPVRLEAALRELNVHDHLRGQLPYDDADRALGLWSTLVNAYQAAGLLAELLATEVTGGRIPAANLDEDAVADALVGAGSLDPLGVLLVPGDEPTVLALRDMAIRCTTLLLFPPVPKQPDLVKHKTKDTGRYWPIVRATLQEGPWSQNNGKRAERRTEVWAAVIAQHFAHRGNLHAADNAFNATDAQFGVRPDQRSLPGLLAACRAGDSDAWNVLVRRHLLPSLINAPEPFITAGQGSEVAANRKGVRRPPGNAVQMLVTAYTQPVGVVTRELLMAFAEAVLNAPESTSGVHGLPPGTFLAPGPDGVSTTRLADKAWFDDTFPKTQKVATGGGSGSGDSKGESDTGTDETDPEDGDEDTGTVAGDEYDDPQTRLNIIRAKVAQKLGVVTDGGETLGEEITGLTDLINDSVSARHAAGAQEEPSEIQKAYADQLKTVKANLTEKINAAIIAVGDL